MCRRWLKKQNIPCEWNLNFETGFASARAVQQCTLLPFLYWWVGVWIKPMTMNAKSTKKYQETKICNQQCSSSPMSSVSFDILTPACAQNILYGRQQSLMMTMLNISVENTFAAWVYSFIRW